MKRSPALGSGKKSGLSEAVACTSILPTSCSAKVARNRVVIALAAALCVLGVAKGEEGGSVFSLAVRPILSEKCFNCHGPDGENRAADLRLDTAEGVRAAFGGGLDTSEAWRRITSADEGEVMPPPETHKPLSDQEKEVLSEWITSGAAWSPHWAFVRPTRPNPPLEYAAHPVDSFIRQRLEREGLKPSQRASREKLIRRVTFDLHGLPPTLEEIDAFVEDTSPDAWERVISRLFASPRYGEKMAVMWLDGARYADTNGYQNDFRRTMWPWRDWVIDAFNRNISYDRFAIEQIAGDLLPEASREQRLATAFNRNHRSVTEAGSIAQEWLVENVVDRVETTSSVFLGLTMGCARCHDHKYDPISQEDFYSFFAFFHSIDEEGFYDEVPGNVGPTVDCGSELDRAELQRLEAQVTLETQSVAELRSATLAAARKWRAESPLPGAISAASAVRLDGAPFAAVVEGERVVSHEEGGPPPEVEPSFLGNVAAFSGGRWLGYRGVFNPQSDRPFTLTAWVKRRGGGAILSKMDDLQENRGVDWMLDGEHRLAVHLIDRWPSSALKVTTQQPLPENVWTHVAVTYDGSSKAAGLLVYLGAEQQPTNVDNDSLAGPVATDQPFRIGRRSTGTDFHGVVGRLRVFERVLTLDELRQVIARDLHGSHAFGADAPASVPTAISTTAGPGPQEASPEQSQMLAEHEEDLLKQFSVGVAPGVEGGYAQGVGRLEAAKKRAEGFRREIPTCMVLKERSEPRETYVLIRGQYDKPDKSRRVTAAIPGFLGVLPLPPQQKAPRLALAEWVASRENPLTARVAVNRLWGLLFKSGLVKTEDNFGVQCEAPSHPELLDWLAVELIDSGWDLRHVLRIILTSETYQQSTAATPESYLSDPDNRLLSRGPRRRLQAEFIRDQALRVSGLLDARIGGPSVYPYQPEGLWEELAGGAGTGPYKQSTGPDLYRRSLYTYRKRSVPHPTTSVFDAPSFEVCSIRRATTNTPLQALALLNDVTYVEAARKLGERMILEGGESPSDRLAYGFRLATSRRPSQGEIDQLLKTLTDQRAHFASAEGRAAEYLAVGDSAINASLDQNELSAYAMVGSLLLNLDESITTE